MEAGDVVTEMPSKEALAAAFGLARLDRDPRYRAYVCELLNQPADSSTTTEFVVATPGDPIGKVLARFSHVDTWPAILAVPDESQPFGYRLLVVAGPEAATLAAWRSTLAIHAEPELYAALTDETTIGDYGPVPMPPGSS